MPRDMSGTGRYPPTPLHQPTEFYGAVRLGDPERLFHVMSIDPYFITQDNGAGAPIHFATTYKQLDMVHHLLNNGADVNQRDDKGLTALHRAAHLAQYDGYLEIYEYLLVSNCCIESLRSELAKLGIVFQPLQLSNYAIWYASQAIRTSLQLHSMNIAISYSAPCPPVC